MLTPPPVPPNYKMHVYSGWSYLFWASRSPLRRPRRARPGRRLLLFLPLPRPGFCLPLAASKKRTTRPAGTTTMGPSLCNPSSTGWGGHLFRRFCKLFSESSPGSWAVPQSAAAMQPKQARGTFRKHITKPSEQEAAQPSTYYLASFVSPFWVLPSSSLYCIFFWQVITDGMGAVVSENLKIYCGKSSSWNTEVS